VLCYSKHVLDLSLHCLVEWIRTIKYSFGYRTVRIADLSRQEAVADNLQPSMLQVPPRRRHHIVGYNLSRHGTIPADYLKQKWVTHGTGWVVFASDTATSTTRAESHGQLR
jgi:hypothetical protein